MAPTKKLKEITSLENDVSMADMPADDVEVENPDPSILAFDEQRIRILNGSTDSAASFEFKNEDHTLGNALRYMIMKNSDVEFCGYSIPHPSEPLMNVRIQTYKGTAVEALEKGLTDLMDLCDVVAEKFIIAREEFDDQMASKETASS